MAPSSTTTAARAPSRKSESIWLSESGVMQSADYSNYSRAARVSDAWTSEIVRFISACGLKAITSVILLPIPTAFRSWDNAD